MNINNNDSDDCNVIDEHALRLYNLVKEKQKVSNIVVNDAEEILERKKKELKESIRRSMTTYREECIKMNMVAWLDEYGNDLYNDLKNKGKTLESIQIKHKDALYIAHYFKATTWWCQHENNYPE